MNRAMKAALFSAFVFPGSGQIYLKRRLRGLIMMALALLGLVILVTRAVGAAMEGLKSMQMDGKTPDINAISNLATSSSANASSDFWTILLVCCWVASVIDAYITGKKKSPST
jgi:hypothetical protein